MAFHLVFHGNAACATPDALLLNMRRSVDGGRVGSPPTRGPDGCQSPSSSSSPMRGPTCTGGGHGEAPPSNAGSHQASQRNNSPLGRHSGSSAQFQSATATPLARTLATRSLRSPPNAAGRPRTQDASAAAPAAPASANAAAVSLPSISLGGASRRDLLPYATQGSAQHVSSQHAQGHGQGAAPAGEPEPSSLSPPPPGTPPAPRPPARASRNSLLDPSPRNRRATAQEHPSDAAAAAATTAFLGGGGGAAAAAAAAAAGSTISAPSTLALEGSGRAEQPPRFSRLQSMPTGARGSGRGNGQQAGLGMGGNTSDPPAMRLSLGATPDQRPAGQALLGSSISMPAHNQNTHLNRHTGLISASPSPSPSPSSQSCASQHDIPTLPLPGRNTPGGGTIRGLVASVDGVPPDAPGASSGAPHSQPHSPGRRAVNFASPMVATPPPAHSARLQASVGQTRAQHHYHINNLQGAAEAQRRASEQDSAGPSASRPPETPRPALKPGDDSASPKQASPGAPAAAGAHEPAATMFRIRQPPPLRLAEAPAPPGGPPGNGPSNTPTSTPTSKGSAARSPAAALAHTPAPTPNLSLGYSRLSSSQPCRSPRDETEADANTISSAGVLNPAADPQTAPPSDADSAARPAHPEPTSPPTSLSGTSASSATPPPERPALPVLPPLGSFVALPTPGDGLLHLCPSAPAGMRRPGAKWGVADFRVMRKLYAGYASSVYRASCVHSGADVVLKAYNLAGLSTFLRHQVLRELHIHSQLDHSGVVQLLAAFKEGDLLVLVLDYVRGGSLDRLRRRLGGRLSEFQARHLVLRPLLAVLAALHARGIMHRDIKPENLLFTEAWQMRVCDFGVSICMAEERPVTRTGSREYMAPEVAVCPLKRGPGDGKDDVSLVYGPGVDVWSLGALTYELLVGFTPFPGGPPQQRKAGDSAPAELAFPAAVSQAARSFVRACLQPDPLDRPTVQQLLAHEWVQDASPENSNKSSSEAQDG